MHKSLSNSENLAGFLHSNGYAAVPLQQNVTGQLLIHAKINGVDGIYILDTGAGRSVVDSKQTDHLKLILLHEGAENTGGGVGGHGLENIPSFNNTLQIDQFAMDNLDVAVMSLDSAWASLAAVGAQEELYGILGVDVLKAGSAILDFNSMTLYLLPIK